jgi:hypothetical protein
LHNPNGVIDNPVKDIFAADKTAYVIAAGSPPPPPPAVGLNTMTGKSRDPLFEYFNCCRYVMKRRVRLLQYIVDVVKCTE